MALPSAWTVLLELVHYWIWSKYFSKLLVIDTVPVAIATPASEHIGI